MGVEVVEQAVAAAAECGERVEDVGQGEFGVVRLRLVERRRTASGHIAALQGTAHATHLLQHLELQLNHLIGPDIGAVVADLLGARVAQRRRVGQDAAGVAPNAAHVAPCEAVGQGRLGIKQHALGARCHDVVHQRDKAVDKLLLVDDVLHHRVHLAVGERIKLGQRIFPVGESVVSRI